MTDQPTELHIVRGRSVGAIALVVGVVWVLAVAGDWFFRFSFFRWQDGVVLSSARMDKGPYEPMGVTTNGVVRGGDLTTLMGAVEGVEEFKEWKPAATNWTDEFGFRNKPPTVDTRFPVVVVGDSFMATGPRMEDTFSGQLADLLGMPVYNYAFEAKGPLWGLLRLVALSDRFLESPPQLIVWGLLEREIFAAGFKDVPALAESLRRARSAGGIPIDWSSLSPRQVRKSLPDSSAIAQVSSRAWGRIRYALFGASVPVVIPADGLIAGRKVLFYIPGIESMKRKPKARGADTVAGTAAYFADLCRRQGTQLLVVLIPDKEDIYREHIPALMKPPAGSIPSAVLIDLEQALRRRGVPVVSLLGEFRAAAEGGRLLYWTDDTHWNTEGIHLAVRAVMPEAKRLLEPDGSSTRK